MEYVDAQTVQGFKIEIVQALAEAIEFATNTVMNDGEHDPEELRQVAQEALLELLTPLPEVVAEAYTRSPLKTPDLDAVDAIFKRLAIMAKLKALDEGDYISLATRKDHIKGSFKGMVQHEGMESVHIGDEYVSVISIEELHA